MIKKIILRLLMCESDRNLLSDAIMDRIEKLQRLSVAEKWVNKENILTDVNDLIKLNNIIE